MFRITVILLLCAAIVCTQMPDIFEGCVRYNRKHEEPQKCTFEPRSRIRGNASFEHIAHLVLKYGKIQPTSGQLNTLLRLTRVATEADGLCRARFQQHDADLIEVDAWCKPRKEHLLISCTALAPQREHLARAFRRQGLPCATMNDVLHPAGAMDRVRGALRAVLEYIDAAQLADRL
ncbi:hypothetical protein HPB52_003221 [Rhipicephalus sanguineus]|uniref:Secreted protein n=1 Tax=Rhipicephalus sanguineus TaxID=34632 RepID=A0A9D4Q9E6_RHISA|nr:hypothetical protein HPB52_003221 [Rhipicephalus sanguineus]